jgi:type VI secretion system protein ImpA
LPIDINRLLKPVPGANPAGSSIRHSPKVFDLQRDLLEDPPGVPNRRRANARAAARAAERILEFESKDLSIAVYLIEAYTRTEGHAGLTAGLRFLLELMRLFWDSLYPEIDPDDPSYRASPLQTLRKGVFDAVCAIPFTEKGYTLFHYTDSRAHHDEDSTKLDELRKKLEERGLVARDDFDRAENQTPAAFYEAMLANIAEAQLVLGDLKIFLDERFPDDDRPSLSEIERALKDQAGRAAEILKHRAPQASTPSSAAPVAEAQPEESQIVADKEQGQEERTEPSVSPVANPEDWRCSNDDSARDAVFKVVKYLREKNEADPAPVLIAAAYCYGSALSGELDYDSLDPPDSQDRLKLRQLQKEEDWRGLLEASIEQMRVPSGRSWLDLPFYIDQACSGLGEEYRKTQEGLRALVAYYLAFELELPSREMRDGTPAAAIATARWLETLTMSTSGPAGRTPLADPEEDETDADPEPMEEAVSIASRGRLAEALEFLRREPAVGGRNEFVLRQKSAILARKARQPQMALSILRHLKGTVDEYRLDRWDPEIAAGFWRLFHETAREARIEGPEVEEAYLRLCAVDPISACSVKP